MDFLDLRHSGGTSLHFHSPFLFIDVILAHNCRQHGITPSLYAAVSVRGLAASGFTHIQNPFTAAESHNRHDRRQKL